jgi:hypothetical protein
MNPKIIVAIALVITTMSSSFANNRNPIIPTVREVAITSSFNKLRVNKNLQIVLTQHTGKSSATIVGDERNVQNVEMNIINDQLVVTSKKNASNGKLVIYIPVENISLLRLANGASVSGEGSLQFDNLTVEMDTDSRVNLKAVGNVILEPINSCELVYETYERSKIIYREQ